MKTKKWIKKNIRMSVLILSVFVSQFLLSPASANMSSLNYVLFDHLGTTKFLVDNEGTVTWPRLMGTKPNETLPFGKDLDFDPEHPNAAEAAYKLNFTNKEIDYDLDLHYFGARYYHATLPRFLSPDPVGGNPEIPISWNRYLYCRNDPVNLFDPDGELWEYAQATGVLTYINDQSGERRVVATGYAGHGNGVNNPAMEDVANIGPIPQGRWTIGASRDDPGGLGPTVMNLDANEGTDTHGRDLFRIHGDNSRCDQSASEGCIILGPAARQEIANSGDNQLIVVQGQEVNQIAVQNNVPQHQQPDQQQGAGLPVVLPAVPDENRQQQQ
jgi:RHS repeat-associated protein